MQPGPDFALPFHVVGQVLLEVLAVPAQLDELLLALLEDAVEALRRGRVAHAPGPLLARAQRGQVIAADERGDAVQRLVVGVPLVVLQDAVGLPAGRLRVAADQIFDRALDVRPVFLAGTRRPGWFSASR